MNIISPPSTIGIMGGGQLGRMLTIIARQMGYQVVILDPSLNCPASYFANSHICANYDDLKYLKQFATLTDVITTEFENVPSKSMQYLATLKPTFPNYEAIAIAQNRLKEKHLFNSLEIATPLHMPIKNEIDIDNISTNNIFPGILKTNTLGYDGKGQIQVNNKTELKNAFNKLQHVSCILEQKIDIQKEVSIIIARSYNEIRTFPIVENIHKNGILDYTIAPANINKSLEQEIIQYATKIIQKLDFIGVLAIEFFITNDNKILANEMAPRPHNSGHFSLDACITSQFEQQLRAICNLKLGDTTLLTNAIMLNLLGQNFDLSNANLKLCLEDILCKYDNLKLHVYDKKASVFNRKMAHLNILGNNIDLLKQQLINIKSSLKF